MEAVFNIEQNKEYITVAFPDKPNKIIRVAGTIYKPFFHPDDVCDILEIENTKNILMNHVRKGLKKTLEEIEIASNKQFPNTEKIGKDFNSLNQDEIKEIYISDIGLLDLVSNSKSSLAKFFLEKIIFSLFSSKHEKEKKSN